jgi:hypothetical protein
MWRYAKVADTPSSLSVLNAVGNMGVLDKLEGSEAQKTLEVTMAPDGNITTEYKRLLGEWQKWASQVKSGNLQKMDAWLALRSTIWNMLEYPLNATTLNRDQCKRIIRPILEAWITRSHICLSFPTALIHAPSYPLGAGIPDLYTVQ